MMPAGGSCAPPQLPAVPPAGRAASQALKARDPLAAAQAVPYLSTFVAALQAANRSDDVTVGPFRGAIIAPQDSVGDAAGWGAVAALGRGRRGRRGRRALGGPCCTRR